jgi:hypothetical protein
MKNVNKYSVSLLIPIENETLKQRNICTNKTETILEKPFNNNAFHETNDETFLKHLFHNIETDEFYERVSICLYEGKLSLNEARKTALNQILQKTFNYTL